MNEYDDYLVDLIQTPYYYAVYFDGDLAYTMPEKFGIQSVELLASVIRKAGRIRVWNFDNIPDAAFPTYRPYMHMDAWDDSGFLRGIKPAPVRVR